VYSLPYEDKIIEYTLIKSKRKTVGIKITDRGEVVVSAPLRASEKVIEEIVLKKARWIVEKLKLVNEKRKNVERREFIDGATIPLLGDEYPLIVEEALIKGSSLKFDGKVFNVRVNKALTNEERQQFIKEVLIIWMRKKAKEIFEERTRYYANRLELNFNKITIKEQKTLWGSCSSKNNINFNWRLVLAPIEVLDYVVVHELCHLKHRNHSKEYWGFVKEAMADYEEKRQWLKINGGTLVL